MQRIIAKYKHISEVIRPWRVSGLTDGRISCGGAVNCSKIEVGGE
jgi:hypothetical protein